MGVYNKYLDRELSAGEEKILKEIIKMCYIADTHIQGFAYMKLSTGPNVLEALKIYAQQQQKGAQ